MLFYTIHVVPAKGDSGPCLMLSAASQQGPGGSIPYNVFHRTEDLRAALESINVYEELIDELIREVVTGNAASIPNVHLEGDDLRKLGLSSLIEH